MQKILNKIKNLELQYEDDKALKEIAQEFIGYYNTNGRHSYSEVSTFIYESSQGDLEYIIENLDIIKNYFNSKVNLHKYGSNIFKLLDHIHLELKREEHVSKTYKIEINGIVLNTLSSKLKDIDKLKTDFDDKFTKKGEDLNGKLGLIEAKYTKLLRKQGSEIDGLHNSIISVLGIFAAIIIAFFGGLSILGSVLQNMQYVSKYRLIFIVLVIGLVIFNVIFMLLHSISKLTGKNIRSTCKKGKCAKCSQKSNWKCVIIKYPLAFWFNVTCVSLLIIIYAMFITDEYDVIISIMNCFKIRSSSMIPLVGALLFIVVMALIVGVSCLVSKFIIPKKDKDKDKVKDKDKDVKTTVNNPEM